MTIRNIIKSFLRFIVIWFVDALAIALTVWLLPGFSYISSSTATPLFVAMATAFILGVINFLIRPILLLLTVPLGGIFVFLFGLFANTVTLMIANRLLPSLQIDSWAWAFLGSLVFILNYWVGLIFLFTGLLFLAGVGFKPHEARNLWLLVVLSLFVAVLAGSLAQLTLGEPAGPLAGDVNR